MLLSRVCHVCMQDKKKRRAETGKQGQSAAKKAKTDLPVLATPPPPTSGLKGGAQRAAAPTPLIGAQVAAQASACTCKA